MQTEGYSTNTQQLKYGIGILWQAIQSRRTEIAGDFERTYLSYRSLYKFSEDRNLTDTHKDQVQTLTVQKDKLDFVNEWFVTHDHVYPYIVWSGSLMYNCGLVRY